MLEESMILAVPVDSGQLFLVDPCYLLEHGLSQEAYQKICQASRENPYVHLADKAGCGIHFSGFGGDGLYEAQLDYEIDDAGNRRLVRAELRFRDDNQGSLDFDFDSEESE